MIKTVIKKGAYFDSVSLMQVAKKLNTMPGVKDSAVVMATKENKGIINLFYHLFETVRCKGNILIGTIMIFIYHKMFFNYNSSQCGGNHCGFITGSVV